MGILNESHRKFGKKFKKACFTVCLVFFFLLPLVLLHKMNSQLTLGLKDNCIRYHHQSVQGQLVFLKESPYIQWLKKNIRHKEDVSKFHEQFEFRYGAYIFISFLNVHCNHHIGASLLNVLRADRLYLDPVRFSQVLLAFLETQPCFNIIFCLMVLLTLFSHFV